MELVSTLLGYVAVFIVAVAVLYWYGTRSARKLEATFPGMPGPKPWPFLGNLPDLLKVNGQIHLHFDRYFKKYGRLYSVDISGEPCIVTSDPEMVKEIMVKYFDCFHNRSKNFKFPKPMDNSLTLLRGEDWRRRIRTTLSPSFSAHKLKGMIPLMNLACDTLVKKIDQVAEAGGSFDILSYQQAVTLDVIMSTTFGIQTDFQNNPDDPIMDTAIKCMKPNSLLQFIGNMILPMFPFGRKFHTSKLGAKIFFKKLIEMADIAQDVVDVRRKGVIRKVSEP